MSSTQHVISPFLRVPPEIRDQIYRNLLLACHSPELEGEPQGWGRNKPPAVFLSRRYLSKATGIHTSILATNKQIASEAARILYTSNVVRFEGSEFMSAWLDTIDPENVEAVRHAEIFGSLAQLDLKALEDVLERCTGLRRFRIESHMMICEPPREPYVCQFLESVKWVLKDHATLRIIASRFPGGYEHEPRRKEPHPAYWYAISTTFLADMGDAFPRDGLSFDVQEAIKQYSVSTLDNPVDSPSP
ncbi:MAG: hypothetical protein HETSPECPRED_000003 [Heterodermia speciosa]|uniref:Uncharacterized protein n=1 Tax=Heterodermia speciosa TaxID=116794 RepID=A0A8H3EGV9_9LECA|nr:MAG: hypothetical protein HETSPECPRED_000003 [Heterodermia speciosa]